jgi:O-acetyl-ADP-ribose deacetylase (regulator of RNase III)
MSSIAKEDSNVYKRRVSLTVRGLGWPKYFHNLDPGDVINGKLTPLYPVDEVLNKKIGFYTGSIVDLDIDAIVNSTNTRCLGAGVGFGGDIRRECGNVLYDMCKELGGCKLGEAKITAAPNLPASKIIHTVGPIDYDPVVLLEAYKSCLDLAFKHNCRTIAFPCISTVPWSYSIDLAAQEVCQFLREYLTTNSKNFDRIVLVMDAGKNRMAYLKTLQMVFPTLTGWDSDY